MTAFCDCGTTRKVLSGISVCTNVTSTLLVLRKEGSSFKVQVMDFRIRVIQRPHPIALLVGRQAARELCRIARGIYFSADVRLHHARTVRTPVRTRPGQVMEEHYTEVIHGP